MEHLVEGPTSFHKLPGGETALAQNHVTADIRWAIPKTLLTYLYRAIDIP